MTKSIVELAQEAGAPNGYTADLYLGIGQDWINKFAALHRASIIKELTGEMPEPVAWRCTNWSGSADDYIYRDADDCAVNVKGEKCGEPLYTATQLREYAAGLVAKAVAAEREQCAALCEQFTHYGEASGITCVKAIRNRGNV
jgi:hypothetical protein